MQTYRIETTVLENGTVMINGLPFQAGDKVEVVVRCYKSKQKNNEYCSLRGKPIRYIDPFESVAGNDWNMLKL